MEYAPEREFSRAIWRTVGVYHSMASRFERGPCYRHFECAPPGDDAIKHAGLEELVRIVYQARHHAPRNEYRRFD